MDTRRDDFDLATELRTLRPALRPEFAADLDARASAGFPRPDSHPATAIRQIAERLRSTPPRRLLGPAGAAALTAIVVATAVVAISEHGATPSATHEAHLSDSSRLAPQRRDGGGARVNRASATNGDFSRRGGGDSSGVQYSEVPLAEPQGSSGGAASADRAIEMLPNINGNHASSFKTRKIERSAQIVLGTDPDRVRADAAKVFDAVHAVDGIVMRSSIRDGAAGRAGAEFELLIPSGKLGDAMADLSSIGEVRSRREATQDITAATIGARERLRDSRATIEGLLNQLAAATTEAERAATEAKLRAERRQATFFAAQLDRLDRRANLSRVSLRIETGSTAISEDGSGSWGVGDGLNHAGRLLEIAAGVTIIGLAALTPLALLALLIWLAYRAWIRAGRRRVLSQTG